jgi:hypothetical protein
MIPPEASNLIQLLLVKTKDRKVAWTTAEEAGLPSSSGGDFVASWPEYSVNVWEERGDEAISFSILDSNGSVTLHFQVTPLDQDFGTMSALFQMAQRSARHADEAIEYLEKALA